MKRAFRESGVRAVKTVGNFGFLLLICTGTLCASSTQPGAESNATLLPSATGAGLLAPAAEPELKSEELDLLSANIATATQSHRSTASALESTPLAPVPEPSTVLFGSALLVACGASLRAVRRKS